MRRSWLFGWHIFCALAGIMSAGATLSAAELEVRPDIEFIRPGGEPVKLDAHLQPGAQPHPLILFVHGGGFVAGDKRDLPHDLLDPLIEAGCSIVSVNYRLAPNHPFPAAPDDVEAALEWVKSHAGEFRFDKSRIALLGGSAGGLLVSLVGARHRPSGDLAAVVALYGEHDLPLRVSEDPCCADGRTFARPEGGCISAGLAAFLGFSTLSPENEKTLRSASATTHVHADMPPYLLVHGTRDFGVPFEQSVSLQQTMLRAGADCTLVPVVGGGHGGWTAPSMQHYRTDVERWLRAKLRLTSATPQNR